MESGSSQYFETTKLNEPLLQVRNENSMEDISSTQAFGFYSVYDQFQLRYFNLSENSNYFFLNNLPISDESQKSFIQNSLQSAEINVIK